MSLSSEDKAAIDRCRGPDGDVEPPWSRFPTYGRYTIGWRMGSGESWMYAWHDFLESELPSTDARVAYLRRHAPAPQTWRDMVEDVLGDGAAALIAEHGLLGDDVAYPRWVAQALEADGVKAPWAWRRGIEPDKALRYSARELGFWARWCHEQRLAGTLLDWLAAQPDAPAIWSPVVAALRSQDSGELDDPRLEVVCAMARAGAPPPPWIEHELPDRQYRWDPPLLYFDAWHWWYGAVFDDEPSRRAYLQMHPPAPATWASTCE